MNVASFIRRCWKILLAYLLFAGYTIYHTTHMGAWFIGSITQAALLMINVYTYTIVADMEVYPQQQRAAYCEQCNQWFSIEVVLMIANTFILVALDHHILLGAIYAAVSLVEIFEISDFRANLGQFRLGGRRRLDPMQAWQTSKAMIRIVGIKLVFHLVMLILYLGYVGPATSHRVFPPLMNADDDAIFFDG